MSIPAGPFESNDYCAIEDVQARLYSGQGLPGGAPPPVDTTRDALLADEISMTSRDFDQEVLGAEYPGLFSWRLETRLFSGEGAQKLNIGALASLIKLEIDATPGQLNHTWQDYTIEVSQNRVGQLPIRVFPKKMLFRQASFYQDPFGLGNIRITGIWGIVSPNSAATSPDAAWQTQYLTPISTNDPVNGGVPTLASVRPSDGGWWTTPDDVRAAVAAWVVHRYQASKTGYGTSSGTGAAKFSLLKTIPDNVQRVINNYKSEHKMPNFALVANDGSDIEPQGYRWQGWQTR